MDPPSYYSPLNSTSTINSNSTTLLITPLSTNITFQVDSNFNQWSLQGEIGLKFEDEQSRSQFNILEINFKGIERVKGSNDIILVDQNNVLWSKSSSDEASTSSNEENIDYPSTSTRFKLDLTPDLPHCLHLINSSLEYSLTAKLSSSNPNVHSIIKSTPIHLLRSSPPGPLSLSSSILTTSDVSVPKPSTTPQTLSLESPISVKVKFERTLFKRSEPIKLIATIQVPSSKVTQEGLRLRTISAELKRKISVASIPSEDEGEEISTLSDKVEIEDQIRILARSGKSCRFSSTRPIVIKLLLHPPPSTATECESISQSTILHTVSFSVTTTITLISSTSSRQETQLQLTMPIFILPDSPSPPKRSEKQKEVERELMYNQSEIEGAEHEEDSVIPTYHESTNGEGEGSTSYLAPNISSNEDAHSHSHQYHPEDPNGYKWESYNHSKEDREEEEEEYDGYEELSASLSTIIPPPTIDEDCSPPSVLDLSPPLISPPPAISPTLSELLNSNSNDNEQHISQIEEEERNLIERTGGEEIEPPSFAEVVPQSNNLNCTELLAHLHQQLNEESRNEIHLTEHQNQEVEEISLEPDSTFLPTTSSHNSSINSSPRLTRSILQLPLPQEIQNNNNILPPPYAGANNSNVISGPPPYLY